jgi:hypothetical protein
LPDRTQFEKVLVQGSQVRILPLRPVIIRVFSDFDPGSS